MCNWQFGDSKISPKFPTIRYIALIKYLLQTFPATSGSTAKSSTDDDPTYVYDYRGLKVRKDSLGREQPEEQEEEQRAKKNQSKAILYYQ